MPYTYPTPTGTSPPYNPSVSTCVPHGKWTCNYQTDLNAFVAAANQAGDKQLATEFKAFALQNHGKYPNLSVEQLLDLFMATGVGNAFKNTIPTVTQDLGAIPGAAAKGAENAINVLGGFNITNWFLRIGEILLGLVLVGVGIARLTGTQNAISKIVKSKVPIPV